ncbi:hypothetical protein [Bradyrhizobium erythrophlei]|jgi:hypothetical protein|uniref:Uncharacterized protein n=1 Tax=Bradyrhizobium erythrophlei TaxID=1437360 RepID=A0A1M7UX23_9BRAD|nr:hypothetical protein [Bradyrhizobium erythrophlei]SHN87504.1 hypothetical protein SAMN05444170_7216 [Bradyrhizobium erythrophlei]
MKSLTADHIEPLDHKSNRSIRDAIGERFQQILRPDPTNHSSRLQHLIDELRRRDEVDGR